jgi:hypothetical protein
MPNPQLNIGNLDFDDIKSSIKSFFKQQDTFKDYDFEGSGLSTMVDVLAYNTLYYAFYSNMIANEMFLDTAQKLSSVISLAKPLGYVVPGSRSSEATVRVSEGGSGNVVPKYTKFIGKDETGRSFNFYNITEESTNDTGVVQLLIYQGSKFFENVIATLSVDRTRCFIGRTDLDIRSLTVKVTPPGGPEEEWILSSSTNDQINSDSKVFFLERIDSGFYIIFSGNISDGINVGVGRPLEENSSISLSYITSSGELANGVGRFTSDWTLIDSAAVNATFQTIYTSSGGAIEPNLDAVKFFAPKVFGAQDRVVTKNDAIAVLARQFINEEDTDSSFRISVWGGEENNPPYYGRLFVSLLNTDSGDININPTGEDVENAVAVLKDKCVVTILPEHIGPVQINEQLEIIVNMNSTETNKSATQIKSQIISALNTKFSSRRSFNLSVKESDLISTISGVDPSIIVDSSGISNLLEVDIVASYNNRLVNVKTPIKIKSGTILNRTLHTTPTEGVYNNVTYTDLEIVDRPQSLRSDGYADIALIRLVDNTYVSISNNVGRINYEKGIIEINANILQQEFKMTLVPKTNSVIGKHEVVLVPKFNVTVLEQS